MPGTAGSFRFIETAIVLVLLVAKPGQVGLNPAAVGCGAAMGGAQPSAATNREEILMRKLLFVLLLVVAGVAGLGFYRGWFTYETTSDSESGRKGIQFEIDQNKITPDIEKAKQKIGGTGQAGEKRQTEKP
jgi:hypothetical protein